MALNSNLVTKVFFLLNQRQCYSKDLQPVKELYYYWLVYYSMHCLEESQHAVILSKLKDIKTCVAYFAQFSIKF